MIFCCCCCSIDVDDVGAGGGAKEMCEAGLVHDMAVCTLLRCVMVVAFAFGALV